MCAGVQVLARGASGWVQREIREDAASSEGIPSASMPTLGFARFARHYPKLVPVHPRAREKFRFCLFTYCHHPHRFHRPTRRPSPTERELALANPMRQLDSRKRDRRVVERFEPHHRCTASLDRPVVLLDDVVEVLAGSDFHVAPERMLSPQSPQRAPTRHMAIDGDLARSTWARSECS